MSGHGRPAHGASTNGAPAERSYFEQQREALVTDVALNLEHVLQNLNKLNRSLEGVIAVGNEFGQVEGLWSQFENVMAKQDDAPKSDDVAEAGASQNKTKSEGHA